MYVTALYGPLSDQDSELLKAFGVEYTEETAIYLNDLVDQDTPDMRSDYDPALRQHIIQRRFLFFETPGVSQEAFSQKETAHPLQRTLATLRYLHHLKLRVPKIVNTLPAALGLNPAKINLTVYSLMKAGLWESSQEFEDYQARLNRGEETDIFMIPVESLLLYLQQNCPDTSRKLISQVRSYINNQVITTPSARKETMKAMLGDPDSRKQLGYLAVVYALKEKLEIEF